MQLSDNRFSGAKRQIGVGLLLAFALFSIVPIVTIAGAEGAPLTGPALTNWAMYWFTEAMAGRTDRAQYSEEFAPQVTDDAVARMSRDLNKYGALPLRAEIVQMKKDDDQSFYVLKFIFPRGDATSLLFGFDAGGKITGIATEGLAGD